MAEKEVTARVRVERDGDTGAVRELTDAWRLEVAHEVTRSDAGAWA